MALTLNLTSEIEQYLSQKATEKGLSLEAYVLKLLMITEEILARSQQIETAAKIKGVDALHIACAEAI
jgi:predicted nucleic acid-binding protein